MMDGALKLVQDAPPIFTLIIVPEGAAFAGVPRAAHGAFNTAARRAGMILDGAALVRTDTRASLYAM